MDSSCFFTMIGKEEFKINEYCGVCRFESLIRRNIKMDNDTLINQARKLYAVLHTEQYGQSIKDKNQFDRLDYLVMCAYCRYQRRLNRCVLCYKNRSNDCVRENSDNKRRFCSLTYLSNRK
jgi:hypothetical protein